MQPDAAWAHTSHLSLSSMLLPLYPPLALLWFGLSHPQLFCSSRQTLRCCLPAAKHRRINHAGVFPPAARGLLARRTCSRRPSISRQPPLVRDWKSSLSASSRPGSAALCLAR